MANLKTSAKPDTQPTASVLELGTAPKTQAPALKTETSAPKAETPAPKLDVAAPKAEAPAPKLETSAPKLETSAPKLDIPAVKAEIPAAIRSVAEKSAKQTKENIENIRNTAEQATDVLEESYSRALDGSNELRVKAIEAVRDNVNATFDFVVSLAGARSLSQVIELHTTHARKQFEAFSSQSKDLAQLAGKVASESTKPYQELVSKSLPSAR